MQVGINTNMGGGVNFSNFYRNTQNRATGSYPKSVPPPGVFDVIIVVKYIDDKTNNQQKSIIL